MSAKTALEKIVLQALVARGMTPAEAEVLILKLHETAHFDGGADVELSSDGKYVAIANVVCTYRSPAKADKQGALLVSINGAEHWIPYVQVAPMSEVLSAGDRGILVIKRWIAEQKHFISSDGKVMKNDP